MPLTYLQSCMSAATAELSLQWAAALPLPLPLKLKLKLQRCNYAIALYCRYSAAAAAM